MNDDRHDKFSGWVVIAFGLIVIACSFGLLDFSLRMFAGALEYGYTPLPAYGMLVSWIVTVAIGVLLLRLGRNALRNQHHE